MTWLDLICLALATRAIADVWFESEIFAEKRAWHEANLAVPPPPEYPAIAQVVTMETIDGYHDRWTSSRAVVEEALRPPRFMLPRPFWSKVLTCRFCYQHHVAFWLLVLFILPSYFVPAPWDWLVRMPIYVLAAIHVATMLDYWNESVPTTKADDDG